jgi:hypothetical protein
LQALTAARSEGVAMLTAWHPPQRGWRLAPKLGVGAAPTVVVAIVVVAAAVAVATVA